ncbi:ABC transporter (plasmid) [Microvirga ossetica]|uniref:ABC transporter n=1 Tax=Microvirga ossetica TaxID=1882682 RepID=A0A1B2EVX9_9HYPH|nr:ABC transporter permease [Microvirga ossetica]ANY84113.1 ABC transporter [Microvirga ossetica]
MIAAARVMYLSLIRDRAALAMAFVLPPLVFIIFATIFVSATGAELRLHVGLLDMVRTGSSQRLVAALAAEPGIRMTQTNGALEDLRNLVRGGMVDVGIALQSDLETQSGQGPPPILVVEDAARALAVPIVIGHVQKAINEHLPDVALGRILADVETAGAITKEERAFLDQAFRAQSEERRGSGFAFAALFSREAATGIGVAGGPVTYYAGAIAAVFLLFAAMQGAATIVEERQSGIIERLMIAPGGHAKLIAGKFVFLLVQGIVQASIIFGFAWLLYGVDVVGSFRAWLASCVVVSAMAAGLSLALCSLCTSTHQIQIMSSFGVLLLSAVGGSMVPRFLMPEWLQQIGWFTPNAWAIEAFQDALQPGPVEPDLITAWAVLSAVTLMSLLIALGLMSRDSQK